MFRRLRKLVHDTRGVSAIEFALILPLMLMVPFGMYQVAEFVRADMQLENAAASIADLIAQQSAGVTSGKTGVLGSFCNAAQLMMTPPSGASVSATQGLSVAMASVTFYSSNLHPTMDWESDLSCPTAATSLGNTLAVALVQPPNQNLVPNAGSPGDSVIIVRATFQYKSFLQYLIPPLTLTQTAFARPRNNATIACTPVAPTPANQTCS
jgi:Flp pilus assembly protein TadG